MLQICLVISDFSSYTNITFYADLLDITVEMKLLAQSRFSSCLCRMIWSWSAPKPSSIHYNPLPSKLLGPANCQVSFDRVCPWNKCAWCCQLHDCGELCLDKLCSVFLHQTACHVANLSDNNMYKLKS